MKEYRGKKVEEKFLILMGIWLFLCSFQDIRRKEIHIMLLFVGIVMAFIGVFQVNGTIENRILGVTLGGILLGMNVITRGQIGVADGIIVGILGITLGFYTCSGILLMALFVSAIVSLILIILKKAKRKTTIPFVPFLLLGYLGVLVLT